MEITLEDVDIAIRILYEFIKKQKQASSLISRLGVGRESRANIGGMSFEQLWSMAQEQVMARKGMTVEGQKVEEPTVSEDDLKRMREIASKLKAEK
jgi:hypothetical protein